MLYYVVWEKNNEANFSELWPHWNKTIKHVRPDIDSIGKSTLVVYNHGYI